MARSPRDGDRAPFGFDQQRAWGGITQLGCPTDAIFGPGIATLGQPTTFSQRLLQDLLVQRHAGHDLLQLPIELKEPPAAIEPATADYESISGRDPEIRRVWHTDGTSIPWGDRATLASKRAQSQRRV